LSCLSFKNRTKKKKNKKKKQKKNRICSACSSQLESIQLEAKDKTELKEEIERVINETKDTKFFQNFMMFLKRNGPFDVIVDGLNVGFFNRKFEPANVISMVNFFEKGGFNRYVEGKRRTDRVLVLAREHVLRHHSLRKLSVTGRLFSIPSSRLDDLYWMYAAVGMNMEVLCVTNDLMKDHMNYLSKEHHERFQRWKMGSRVTFAIRLPTMKVEVEAPIQHNPVLQSNSDRTIWHVPLAEGDWLCFKQQPLGSSDHDGVSAEEKH